MASYSPPYTITDKTVTLVARITEIITSLTLIRGTKPNPKLRRENRIKTIQASLAIENNSLTISQVTDVINGKRILGAPSEICEVKNAYEAYEKLLDMNPCSIKDFFTMHKILMKDLTKEAGAFRSGGVGIFAGDKLIHMAPPANRVPELVQALFDWMKTTNTHPLIKSCVFHYEFEFIHPFSDGNGRMGRMWQTLLLYQWNLLFGWLPIETIVKERQDEYYRVLAQCDKAADSSAFIEYMLQAIHDTLVEITRTEQVTVQVTEQVERLLDILGNRSMSTKEMMEKLELKHRPTFRDNYLLPALDLGLIEMTIPDKPNSSRQKYRKA